MDYSGDYNCIMDYCWYFYLFCLQLCTTKFCGLASHVFDASKCTCKLDYSSGTIFQAFTYSVYLFIYFLGVFVFFCVCVCVCVCVFVREIVYCTEIFKLTMCYFETASL